MPTRGKNIGLFVKRNDSSIPTPWIQGATWWFDVNNYVLKVWNGTEWLDRTSSGAGGVGTVTSVALTMPSGFTVTGSPITTFGTLTVTTALSGIIKAAAGVFSAAVAGTDYVGPGAITTSGLTMGTGKLLGRSTSGTGAVEEITVGSGLTLSAGTLTSSGGSGMSIGGTVTSGTANRVLFVATGPVLAQSSDLQWDDSAKIFSVSKPAGNATITVSDNTSLITNTLSTSSSSGVGGVVGTTTNHDLWFLTNNTKQGFFSAAGQFIVGIAGVFPGTPAVGINRNDTTFNPLLYLRQRSSATTSYAAIQIEANNGNVVASWFSDGFSSVFGTGTWIGNNSNHPFGFYINNVENWRILTNGQLQNKISGNETTGGGSAALGSNSPATTNTAPYTWQKVTTSDGSQGYIPIWK